MKKILLFILVLMMSFTLAACGVSGGENDEKNAAVQAKFDQADALFAEIRGWYEDKGYLEGDTAAEVEAVLATLKAPIEELKAEHQAILDDGGYTDEDVSIIDPILDTTLAELEDIVAEQEAYDVSEEEGTGIAPLIEKANQLTEIVQEASDLATANGWLEDEAFSAELEAVLTLLEETEPDLENSENMDEAYMNELSVSFDELITVWQGYLTQVSEPYNGN